MSQPKVLIVEDERALVQSLTWYFTREGYETVVATDGQESPNFWERAWLRRKIDQLERGRS